MLLIGDVAARGAPVSTEARESQRSHRAGIRVRSRSRNRIRTSHQAEKYSAAALAGARLLLAIAQRLAHDAGGAQGALRCREALSFRDHYLGSENGAGRQDYA
jgi:hypothetical protein